MNNAPNRVVFQVELDKQTVEAFEKICEETGITRIALASKIINWLTSQPAHIQANLLGMFGEKGSKQATRDVLNGFVNRSIRQSA